MAEESPRTDEFATLLDRALRSRRMTLAGLSRRLEGLGSPVSIAALSYWRSGQRRPERGTSLDALAHIEQILGLETDALISRLGPSRRVGPDVHEEFDALVGVPDGLAGVLAAIDCATTDALVSTGGAVTVDVGPDRAAHLTSNRIVWRARRDGVARTATYLQLDSPAEDIPTVRAVQGCRLGRRCYDEVSGFVAWELVLDRPQAIGETVITEVAYEIQETEPLTRYACVAERRISEGVLWVRFDGRALPQEIHAFESAGDLEQSRLVPLVGTSVHHVVQGFGPGSFGLDWSW